METFLLLFGLGFFIWVVWHVEAADEKQYQRKLNERREFGYREQTNQNQNSTRKQ